MITQGGGNLDLAAVAADDALLDLLAARGDVPADDALAGLLAAFADEVDDGLAALLDEAGEDQARPALVAVPAVPVLPVQAAEPIRRGYGLRATTIALVVGATLSVSGVAAAVTGDPFAPYRGIVSAFNGDNESGAQAARMAWLQRQLAGTRAKVAHGDLAGADADLTKMRARLAATDELNHGQRTALEARIAALEAALARAHDRAKDAKKAPGTPGAGPAVTPGPHSTTAAVPQNTRTPDPQNTKAPESRKSRTPDSQDTKKATAGSTVAPEPESTPAPEPRHTKTPTPQNTKHATPLVSTTAVSTGVEQAPSTDSHGSAKAERPAH